MKKEHIDQLNELVSYYGVSTILEALAIYCIERGWNKKTKIILGAVKAIRSPSFLRLLLSRMQGDC